jgi:hypothetical protein
VIESRAVYEIHISIAIYTVVIMHSIASRLKDEGKDGAGFDFAAKLS